MSTPTKTKIKSGDSIYYEEAVIKRYLLERDILEKYGKTADGVNSHLTSLETYIQWVRSTSELFYYDDKMKDLEFYDGTLSKQIRIKTRKNS